MKDQKRYNELFTWIAQGNSFEKSRTQEEGSLLHTSIAYKNWLALELFLWLGLDPTIPDEKGKTPLDLATFFGAERGIELLREYHPNLKETLL